MNMGGFSGALAKIFKPASKLLGLDIKPRVATSQARAEKTVAETEEEALKKKKALLTMQDNQYGTSGGQLGQEFTNGKSGRSNIFGN